MEICIRGRRIFTHDFPARSRNHYHLLTVLGRILVALVRVLPSNCFDRFPARTRYVVRKGLHYRKLIRGFCCKGLSGFSLHSAVGGIFGGKSNIAMDVTDIVIVFLTRKISHLRFYTWLQGYYLRLRMRWERTTNSVEIAAKRIAHGCKNANVATTSFVETQPNDVDDGADN